MKQAALLSILLIGLSTASPAFAGENDSVIVNLDVLEDNAAAPPIEKETLAPITTPSSSTMPSLPVGKPMPSGMVPLKWVQTKPAEKKPVAPPVVTPPKAPSITPVTKPVLSKPLMTGPILKPKPPVAPQMTRPAPVEIPQPRPVEAHIPAPAPIPAAALASPPAPVPAEPSAPAIKEAPASPAVPAHEDLALNFDVGSSDLALDTQQKLDNVIEQMIDNDGLRLQLRAYAKSTDETKSSARRLSLSRALAVRSYLMDHNISPARVDVRALGSETDRTPLDRVDVVFVN